MLTETVSLEDQAPVQASDAIGAGEPPIFAGGKLRADRRIVGPSIIVGLLLAVDVAMIVGGLVSGVLS